MNAFRMLTVQVEVDCRRLGGSSLLIPFQDAWLASHTCRDLLQQVLDQHLGGSDALSTAENVTLFCSKRQEIATGSGPCKSSVANASACMDYTVLSVIDAFSTLYFAFKIVAKSINATTSTPSLINAFEALKRTQLEFITLPPLLAHSRMYANHDAYNELLAFLEKHALGWNKDTAKKLGHRFIDGMSKAFFQCTPATWAALNDKHNSGAFSLPVALPSVVLQIVFLIVYLFNNFAFSVNLIHEL